MSYRVADVIRWLEALAPTALAESWDRVGLQVGDPGREVRSLFVALALNHATLEQAEACEADLIVVHHPFIFHAIETIRLDQPSGRDLARLIRLGCAVYAAHTNLDAAPGGVGAWLADRIGIADPVPLIPHGAGPQGSGLGRIGAVVSEAPERFLHDVAAKLELPALRTAGPAPRSVARVAVLGGSGGSFIAKAADAGADAYITGDVDYHDALEAEAHGLWVIDAGHFGTERWIVPALAEVLRERAGVGGFEVHEAREDDPFSVSIGSEPRRKG